MSTENPTVESGPALAPEVSSWLGLFVPSSGPTGVNVPPEGGTQVGDQISVEGKAKVIRGMLEQIESLGAHSVAQPLATRLAEGLGHAEAGRTVKALKDLGTLETEVRSALKSVGGQVGSNGQTPTDLDEFMKEDRLAEFDSRYGKLALLRDDLLEYPADYASEEITKIQEKVKKADEAITAITPPIDKTKAAQRTKALGTLEAEIKAGTPVLKEHDKQARAYFATLKKTKSDINTCEALPLTVTGGDAPWKAERQAYDTQKAQVVEAQNKKDFKTANTALATLQTNIKTLIAKRMEQVTAKVNEATGTKGSAKKCKELVDDLAANPGLISAMKPEEQLKVLETLRQKVVDCNACGQGMSKRQFEINGNKCISNKMPACNPNQIQAPKRCRSCSCPMGGSANCPRCNGTNTEIDPDVRAEVEYTDGSIYPSDNLPLLQARAKVFANMTMEEKFVVKDKENRKKLLKNLRGVEDKKPDESWEDFQKRQDSNENYKKFKEAEENWATWAKTNKAKMEEFLTHVVKEQCKILGHTTPKNLGPDFPDIPVRVVLEDIGTSDYGDTSPALPATIRININPAFEPSFSDFKEMIDTTIHENSHAWQNWIIAKMSGKNGFGNSDKNEILNDPDLATQAKMFLENDQTYINSGVDPEAYRHEPLEEQAWNFGGASAQTLLVPPQVRSFKSGQTMKSKTLFVKSITREAKAVVTCKERHGIYKEEWEGETPKGKKVILEGPGVPGGKQEVTIRKIEDQYQIKISFDGTTLPTPLVDPGRIDTELKALSLTEFSKPLSELLTTQRDTLNTRLATTKGYTKVDIEPGKAAFREPATFKEAEAAGLRLRLDETVAKL